MTSTNRWGIEISGGNLDIVIWQAELQAPFDPFVEKVEDERGDYLVLRSSVFDEATSIKEVYDKADELIRTLNVTFAEIADAEPVTGEGAIEFVADGPPVRHYRVKLETGHLRLRGAPVTLVLKDSEGNLIHRPPVASRAQQWHRAAVLEPEIGKALNYLEHKPGWGELYKAYEALRKLPNVGVPKDEIRRFTHTANTGNRHHPNPKQAPPNNPMELWEARAFITGWISAVIDEVLKKKPVRHREIGSFVRTPPRALNRIKKTQTIESLAQKRRVRKCLDLRA